MGQAVKPEPIIDKVRRYMWRRKPKGPTARRRAAKRRQRKAGEIERMQAARARDVYCRFPVCGCRTGARPGVVSAAEVSHQKHRGMGGNPSGDRTVPALLVLICNWRHKLAKFSIDRGGIRWEPLTPAGADGPIRWLIDAEAMQGAALSEIGILLAIRPDDGGWVELARETAPHEYAPMTEAQTAILEWLAEMTA